MKIKALTSFKHDVNAYEKDQWYEDVDDDLARYFMNQGWAEDEDGNGKYPAENNNRHHVLEIDDVYSPSITE